MIFPGGRINYEKRVVRADDPFLLYPPGREPGALSGVSGIARVCCCPVGLLSVRRQETGLQEMPRSLLQNIHAGTDAVRDALCGSPPAVVSSARCVWALALPSAAFRRPVIFRVVAAFRKAMSCGGYPVFGDRGGRFSGTNGIKNRHPAIFRWMPGLNYSADLPEPIAGRLCNSDAGIEGKRPESRAATRCPLSSGVGTLCVR